MATIYRIEHPVEMNGMWYSKDRILHKQVHILCPYGTAKDLPMPFNPEHYADGLEWFSAGKSIENMNQWFTPRDAINLHNNGYKLFEFEVNQFKEFPYEILFTREGIIHQKEIPLETVWDIAPHL